MTSRFQKNGVVIMSIGIWCHGRKLGTPDWEGLLWGNPAEQRLGTLPTMALVALDAGLDSVSAFGIGTGSSKEGGLYEAQLIQQLFSERLGELDRFDIIRDHRDFERPEVRQQLRRLVDEAVLDLESQNTAEEISYAAQLFSDRGVTHVIQVTCGSHAPRCMNEQIAARHDGRIPRSQRWSVVGDDTLYAGSTPGSTVVAEDGHRLDDPMTGRAKQLPDVVRRFFGVPAADKPAVLDRLDAVFADHAL